MKYRRASRDDAAAIARLHASSWRRFYRGALSDEFLNGDIDSNRLELWEKRLGDPASNQLVTIAEDDAGVVGFACAYAAHDERWGTLLDNLHVSHSRQGHGIGRRLMSNVAGWCLAEADEAGLYLWVLEQNVSARRFYERLGGNDVGGDEWASPGGRIVPRRRYAWSAAALRGMTVRVGGGVRP